MNKPSYLKWFSALIGIATLVILLQGLWAGIFLEHDGARAASGNWIDTHARGADFSILLSLIALALVAVKIRHRRELLIGSAVMVVLLVVESYIGGQIRDNAKNSLTAVHVPLAMGLMAVGTWLSLKSSSRNAQS